MQDMDRRTEPNAITISQQASQRKVWMASKLQSEAWEAYNRAYHTDDPETYRKVGRELYHQNLLAQIRLLLDRSDQQNSIIREHFES